MFKKLKLSSLCIALGMCGALCVSGCDSSEDTESVLKDNLTSNLDVIKNKDEAFVTAVESSIDLSNLESCGLDGSEFAMSLLDGFDYSLGEVVIDEDIARIEISVTSKKLSEWESAYYAAYNKDVEDSVFTSMTDDEIQAYAASLAMDVMEQLELSEAENFTIVYIYDGESWDIEASSLDTLYNIFICFVC